MSASVFSAPMVAASQNCTPASMTIHSSSNPIRVMFIPISPSPPRGSIVSVLLSIGVFSVFRLLLPQIRRAVPAGANHLRQGYGVSGRLRQGFGVSCTLLPAGLYHKTN